MDDLRVGVWKKSGQAYRLLSNIHLDNQQMSASVSLAPRFNSAGTWSCSMPWDLQPKGLSKASLFRFDFRGISETCRVERFGVETDEAGMPLLVVSGTTMTSMLGDAIGWPSPDVAAEEQLSVRWYREGVAEDVLSAFISRNLVDRLGYDVRVMPSQGRGLSVTVNSEFHNVLEVVQDAATYAGLRLHVGLVNTTSPTNAEMRVWFDEPTVHDKVRLSAADGNLRAYKKASEAPTATRAIVQAGKEHQNRQVASVDLGSNVITTGGDRQTKNREVETVNVAGNTITTKSSHEMATGSRIQITGGTPPAPLEADTSYYVIKVDSNTLRVAASREAALNGNAIGLTNNGAGKIVVTKITIRPVRSRLRTGDIITFSQGTPPEPLDTGVAYHAIRVDSDSFKVAMTRSDALAGITVDLTDAGDGDITVTEQTYRYREVTSEGPEETWGRVREIFVEGDGENREEGLTQQGKTALLDGSTSNSVELEVEEVPGARLGDPLQLGDTVPYTLSTGETGTDVIGSAEIVAAGEGLVVKLTLGNPDGLDSTKQQAADIRRIKRNVRKRRKD